MRYLTDVIPRPSFQPEAYDFVSSLARVRRWSIAATVRAAIEELMRLPDSDLQNVVIPNVAYGSNHCRVPNVQISAQMREWIDKFCKLRGVKQVDVARAAIHYIMTKK